MPTAKEIMKSIGVRLESSKATITPAEIEEPWTKPYRKDWRSMTSEELELAIREQNDAAFIEIKRRESTNNLLPFIHPAIQPVSEVAEEVGFTPQHLLRLIKVDKVAGFERGGLYFTTVYNTAYYMATEPKRIHDPRKNRTKRNRAA